MMVSAVGITSDTLFHGAEAVAQVRVGAARRSPACLVVTGNQRFRERMQSVAEIADWSVCVAPSGSDDLLAGADADYRLVVIDIAEPCGDRVHDSIRLAEDFVGRPGTLVVICGSGESIDEELWARQLGAWIYLPGVSSGDDLVEAFVEARRLAGFAHRLRQFV